MSQLVEIHLATRGDVDDLASLIDEFAVGHPAAGQLIASLCAGIRDAGGSFLRASYDAPLAALYERVAVGRPIREFHLSAKAFRSVAELAGATGRESARNLPDPQLSFGE